MAFNAGWLQIQDWRKQRDPHKQRPISSELTTTSFTNPLHLVSQNLKIIKFTANSSQQSTEQVGCRHTHTSSEKAGSAQTEANFLRRAHHSLLHRSPPIPPCSHKRKDNQPQIPRHNLTRKWPSSMHLHRLQGCEQKEAQRSARTNPRFPSQNLNFTLDLAETTATNIG